MAEIQCTAECRDEHCTTPIACEQRGQCPSQNPILLLPALIRSLSETYRQFTGECPVPRNAEIERLHAMRADLVAIAHHLQRAHGWGENQLAASAHVDVNFIRSMVDGLRVDRDKARADLASLAAMASAATDIGDREFDRIKKLVGSEDVGSNWASIDRYEAIRQAEQFFAEAESLRNDRTLLWELLKRAARTYRENDEQAMAEWRDEVAAKDAEIARLSRELDLTVQDRFDYDGAMARIAEAVVLPVNSEPGDLLQALRDMVAASDAHRSSLAQLRSKVDEEHRGLADELHAITGGPNPCRLGHVGIGHVRGMIGHVAEYVRGLRDERDKHERDARRLTAECTALRAPAMTREQWDRTAVTFGFDPADPTGPLVVALCGSHEHRAMQEHYAGALAAVAVATELPPGTDPDELIEALAGVVAEREELRGDLAVLRSRVDDVREATRALFPTLGDLDG